MGKCSVCGKGIQYNQFVKYQGKIYCKNCIPKEANKVTPEQAHELAQGRFGEPTKDTSKDLVPEEPEDIDVINKGVESTPVFPDSIPDNMADTPEVQIGEDEELAPKKKPRKKRSKKNTED